jgi:hypothetical protein
MLQFAGCRHHDDGPSAEFRMVDTVREADSLSLVVDGKTVLDDSQFAMPSEFQQVPIGDYTLHVIAKRAAADDEQLAEVRCTFEQDKQYTGVVLGSTDPSTKARLIIFTDVPVTDIPDAEAKVRIIDAYPHAAKLDVTVNNIVAFSNLSFGLRSKPVLLPAKSYDFKALREDSYTQPAAGPVSLDLIGGKSYQLVVLGSTNNKQPGFILLSDD